MIYIIQNGYIRPNIPRYLDEDYKIAKSYECDVTEEDLTKYSLVIILGGHQSVTKINSTPYLLNVVELITNCIATKKPLFGICLGAQLIAHALGCEIRWSGRMNIGFDIEILGNDKGFRSHSDYIVPNNKIVVLNEFEGMPYLYRFKSYVYGIQSHPNFPAECIIKYSGDDKSIEYAKRNVKKIDKSNFIIIRTILALLRGVKKN